MKENLVRQQQPQDDLQREFELKNGILRSKFQELSPQDYLNFIFPDLEKFIVVIGSLKDNEGNVIERGTVTRVDYDDLWGIAWRPNAYLPYCTFKNNYYHSKTLDTVRAFVVDLDNVSSRNLTKVLRYAFKQIPQPTHLVNSGKGIHLVYTLLEPVEAKGLRWTLNTLNGAIQDAYEKVGHLDKHPIVHPYRFPGFATKINTKATVFRIRDPYSLEELLELFKVPKKRTRSKKKENQKKAEILYLPNGRRAFFEWVLWKLFGNPPIPGRRHNSFFALGIIAYKCRREVPEWEAVEAVDMVYDDMERYNLHIGFTREEAHSAFRKGYNPKAVRVRWKYLCELLGWEYRPNKRNGRTRKEHVKLMNRIRLARCQSRWEELEEHIKRLLDLGYSKREIAEMVGIHHSTLYRRFGHLLKQKSLE